MLVFNYTLTLSDRELESWGRKELNVKTPFQAIEKWFLLKPEIFKIKPEEFKNKILNLNQNLVNLHQQPCET